MGVLRRRRQHRRQVLRNAGARRGNYGGNRAADRCSVWRGGNQPDEREHNLLLPAEPGRNSAREDRSAGADGGYDRRPDRRAGDRAGAPGRGGAGSAQRLGAGTAGCERFGIARGLPAPASRRQSARIFYSLPLDNRPACHASCEQRLQSAARRSRGCRNRLRRGGDTERMLGGGPESRQAAGRRTGWAMTETLKLDNQIGSAAANDARAKANRAALLKRMAELSEQERVIREGGGVRAAEAQRAKGRLTVRERLKLLLDEGTELFELGLWAAYEMYSEYGGAPAAGVVTGLGRVSGRLCMIVANDATVKAGAFFPMTAKKVLRAQQIALDNRIPTLYLVDSSGVFLPLQEDVFPDQDDFGRVFRNNAVMSALGVPQITAIMGMCVAGGAYLPVMTDTVLMTEGSGLFLAGPSLVQAAIGQKTGAEELGGASMHSEISGTVDFKEPNDEACIARLRSLVGKMGQRAVAGCQLHVDSVQGVFSRVDFDAVKDAPKFAAEDLYGLIDPDPARAATNTYDMREVIAR